MNDTAAANHTALNPTVFIVDDDDGMRQGLAFLLKSAKIRHECFDSANAFLDFYDPAMRGCMLLDIRMPGMTGLQLQEHLRERGINLPVIMLTAYADVPMAVRAMHAGAFEFFEKPFDGPTLIDRVRRALDHDARQRYQQQQIADVRQKLQTLTPREREVMELIVTGILNKEMADMLKISIKTVENHRAAVMKKMQADYLADLVRMGMLVDMC